MEPLNELFAELYHDEKTLLGWLDIQRDWRHGPDSTLQRRWERGNMVYAWRKYVIRAIGNKEGVMRSYVVKR